MKSKTFGSAIGWALFEFAGAGLMLLAFFAFEPGLWRWVALFGVASGCVFAGLRIRDAVRLYPGSR